MNPVRVFPLKSNEQQNTQSTSSSPQLKKKQTPKLIEKPFLLNMSPILNGQSPIKGKFNVKRLNVNPKQEDKFQFTQQQRPSQSTSSSPIKRVINGATKIESQSPMKLPNLRRADTQLNNNIQIKDETIQEMKSSKRKDTTTDGTSTQQIRGSIIKLISESTPDTRPSISRAKLGSQTIEQDIKTKASNQIVMLHGRSTSQATLVNTFILDNEMQDYVNLFYSKSQAGQNGQGQTKTNQDSIIVTNNLGGIKNRYIFSVCDGHGVYGHYVSQLVKKLLPNIIDQQIKSNIGMQEKDIGENHYNSITKAMTQSFLKMQKDLSNCGIDITFSGTTCSLVLISGPHLWCANIGDSRSILIQQQNNQKWKTIELSNDHKPDLPNEYKRIISSKGRVEPFISENGEMIGPPRVWLLNDQIPGLAMSRSFGDYVASTVGVSCEPEIIHYRMNTNFAFLVVASDGVWEFFSNEEIQKIVVQYWQPNMTAKKLNEICDHIVKLSTQRWHQEDEVVDDISIVIAYLQKT
ncbi:unnamed protein product [Paramecium primaurelia]|uniref:PPM-type phosphatase domain-containing protein n=1 Tax=Paramecium primaurelia TaxID=5886 RepID=A0A8S1K1E6_PARPR|nr:unnamed protein product [Paramecium primaurelia]